MIEPTLGFILHQYAVGESSLYVTFFTRERGILKTRIKGGRTPKKKALFQSFIPLWITLQDKATMTYIQQVEIFANPIVLSGSSLFAGLYVNELLYYLLQPAQEEAGLFNLYQNTITQLSHVNSNVMLEGILRQFEWSLLEALGTQVSFTHERDGGLPIEPDECYHFMPGEGFFCASQGLKGEHLLAIAEQNFTQIQVLKTAKWIMRRSIEHLLDGRPIHSRSLYCA